MRWKMKDANRAEEWIFADDSRWKKKNQTVLMVQQTERIMLMGGFPKLVLRHCVIINGGRGSQIKCMNKFGLSKTSQVHL